MPIDQVLTLLLLGLASGVLGGMLGIGGSIIMIPVLALALGPNQHLYQAAAMIVNVVVAIPATIRHKRAGAIRLDVVIRMLPWGLVMIIVGVAVSDVMEGRLLQRVFGVFLIYVIIVNTRKLLVGKGAAESHDNARVGWARCGFVGSIVGFTAGLLGVGGGVVTVPLLQRLCHLPLRQCIACSSAVMCITAVVGAIRKNITLSSHVDLQAAEDVFFASSAGLEIALFLAPTALVGAFIGAGLTHRLPLRWVRLAFILLLVFASARMLGLM